MIWQNEPNPILEAVITPLHNRRARQDSLRMRLTLSWNGAAKSYAGKKCASRNERRLPVQNNFNSIVQIWSLFPAALSKASSMAASISRCSTASRASCRLAFASRSSRAQSISTSFSIAGSGDTSMTFKSKHWTFGSVCRLAGLTCGTSKRRAAT
jgi:hypothetical protein